MFSLAIYWGNCLLSILIAKLGLMIDKEKILYWPLSLRFLFL